MVSRDLAALVKRTPGYLDFVREVVVSQSAVSSIIEEYPHEFIQELYPMYIADASTGDSDRDRICYIAQPDILDIILEYRPKNISKVNMNGSSPLHLAVDKYNIIAVKMLLNADAVIDDRVDKNALTPYGSALEKVQYICNLTPYDKNDTVSSVLERFTKMYQKQLITALDPARYKNNMIRNIQDCVPYALVLYNQLIINCITRYQCGFTRANGVSDISIIGSDFSTYPIDMFRIDNNEEFSAIIQNSNDTAFRLYSDGYNSNSTMAKTGSLAEYYELGWSNLSQDNASHQALFQLFLNRSSIDAPSLVLHRILAYVNRVIKEPGSLTRKRIQPALDILSNMPRFSSDVLEQIEPDGDSHDKRLVLQVIKMYLNTPVKSMIKQYIMSSIKQIDPVSSLKMTDDMLARKITLAVDDNGRTIDECVVDVLPSLAYKWYSSTYSDVHDLAKLITSDQQLFEFITTIMKNLLVTRLTDNYNIIDAVNKDLVPFLSNAYRSVIQTIRSEIRSYGNFIANSYQAIQILYLLLPEDINVPHSPIKKIYSGSLVNDSKIAAPIMPDTNLVDQEDLESMAFMNGIQLGDEMI